jgi:hypothetical protein
VATNVSPGVTRHYGVYRGLTTGVQRPWRACRREAPKSKRDTVRSNGMLGGALGLSPVGMDREAPARH